jgi:hypothetical protein
MPVSSQNWFHSRFSRRIPADPVTGTPKQASGSGGLSKRR